MDAQDEQDPAPLVTPNAGGDIQWVVDESPEDEPIETWDATASEPAEDTPQQEEEGLATLEAPAPEVPQTETEAPNDMSDSDDLLPALSEEEEEEEFDTVRPGQPSPVSHEPIAAEPVEEKPKGASVRLKTIKVSKKTAAPRQSASVRVSPSATPDEDVLALEDSFDFHQVDSEQTDGRADSLESEEDKERPNRTHRGKLRPSTECAQRGHPRGSRSVYSDVIDRDGQHYEAYLERGRVHLDLVIMDAPCLILPSQTTFIRITHILE